MAKTAAKSPRKTKTIAYDVAEQLRTPEEMAAYLDAWFEEAPDDAAGIARRWGILPVHAAWHRLPATLGLAAKAFTKRLARMAIQALPRSSRWPVHSASD